MKILKSCGSPSWGGLEMYLIKTAEELLKMGHDVRLVCLPNSEISRAATSEGIKFLPYLRNGTGRIISILKLNKLIRLNNFDVIHTHLSHDLWTIVPALKLSRLKTKLILTKCMASGVTKKDMFHKCLYDRVDKITAVSRFISKNVIETCPVPEEKIVILHDSISLSEFDPERFNKKSVKHELGFDEKDVVVGMIGRITPGKGYEIFFESIKRITAQPGIANVRFLSVGTSSPDEKEYEEELITYADTLGVKDKIEFKGYQRDIPKYLSAIDVLAFPSNEESFGGTALEAMAMEVPVVSFDYAGVPDIIVDKVTGYLAPHNDINAFTQALLKLINDPALRKRMGIAGRKRAKEHFEINSNMRTALDIYSQPK